MEFLFQIIPNVMNNLDSLWIATVETMQMLIYTSIFSAPFGIALGVIMVVCREDGIMKNKPIWWICDKIINLFRCIPFMLLVFAMFPVTRALVGTTLFVKGAIPPLVVGTIPFFARQIESSLLEIDSGLIEASQAMGDSPMQTIFRVYLKESIPSMIRSVSITMIALIGNSTICGAFGAGGLGSYAYNHGYIRHEYDVIYFVLFLLLLITTMIQSLSERLYKKVTH